MNFEREIDLKILDHCFDLIKFLLSLFTSIVVFYLTLLLVFSAIIASDMVAAESKGAFRTIGVMATGGMSLILLIFYALVVRSGREYRDRILSLVSADDEIRLFERAYDKMLVYGKVLFGIACIALFCVAFFLVTLKIS